MTDTPFSLSDAWVETVARLHPVMASFMGVAGHDDRWDDFSPAGVARWSEAVEDFRRRAHALPPQTDRWARLAAQVLTDSLDQESERIAHGDHLDDLNSIASTFQNIRQVFDVMDTSTSAGWASVVARLETLGTACEGYRATLESGRAQGRTVAARQVHAVVTQGRVHAGEGSSFHRMTAAFDATPAVQNDAVLRARLTAAIPAACAAYGSLCDWLEGPYLTTARTTDGVGRGRYLRDARRFLGMSIDPEETYAWGWTEVRSIGTAMEALAARIAPGKSVRETVALLRADPTRCAPTREAFLTAMRARQERALADLDGRHFDIPDAVRRIEVKAAPAGGPLGAYYVPPSEDFSRPGTVWYSFEGEGPFGLWDEISTAYHEGFPGHHLQCGIQVSLTERLSRWHRLGEGYSGYAEGWALYTEKLMGELGYYELPEYEFGMLACQMMRACRVVIDIGSHLDFPIPADAPFHPGERWSFDLAVEVCRDVAGMTHEHAVSEVTRYLGWPGQAISYKVGERVMLALREEFRSVRGKAFDLKDFHARVVGSGPVGLARLRDIVLTD